MTRLFPSRLRLPMCDSTLHMRLGNAIWHLKMCAATRCIRLCVPSQPPCVRIVSQCISQALQFHVCLSLSLPPHQCTMSIAFLRLPLGNISHLADWKLCMPPDHTFWVLSCIMAAYVGIVAVCRHLVFSVLKKCDANGM